MRRGGGVGIVLDGVVAAEGDRGGMVIMDGLAFLTSEKECVSVLVFVIESNCMGEKIMGWTFFGEALTGERERGTWSAEGGALRVPLRMESRWPGRLGVLGTGGVGDELLAME